MIIKIIGSILIISSSSFIGLLLSFDCIKRPNEIRMLQSMFHILLNEICFLSNLLKDAFDKVTIRNKSPVAVFFKDTIKNLDSNNNLTASMAWELAIINNIKKTALNKEDGEILISFGKMLGTSDIEGQIKSINLLLEQLKLQEKKAEQKKQKNSSMYRNLGILGGLTIIIILL